MSNMPKNVKQVKCGVSGISQITHRIYGLKFFMLMNEEHLQNGLDFCHGFHLILWNMSDLHFLPKFSVICIIIYLVCMGRMAWNSTCWYIFKTPLGLIRFCSWSVDFSNFWSMIYVQFLVSYHAYGSFKWSELNFEWQLQKFCHFHQFEY